MYMRRKKNKYTYIIYIYIYEEMVLYLKMRIIRLCDSDLYIKGTYIKKKYIYIYIKLMYKSLYGYIIYI